MVLVMKNLKILYLLIPLLMCSGCDSSSNISSPTNIPDETSSIEDTRKEGYFHIYTNSPHGEVVLESDYVEKDSTINFTIAPFKGWEAFLWYIESDSGALDLINKTSFTMPSEDVTITVTYKSNYLLADTLAHTGYGGGYTNAYNTRRSFTEASQKNFAGIETDIQITLDGKFVCAHDPYFVSGGKQISISNNNYDDIKNYIIDNAYGDTEAKIVPFEDYLEICKSGQKLATIELKSYTSKAQCEKLIGIIEEKYDLNNVMFISFSMANLENIKNINSGIRCAYLVNEYSGNIYDPMKYLDEDWESYIELDVTFSMFDEEVAKAYHDLGIKVGVYTVDSKESAIKYQNMGADYITTNLCEMEIVNE